MKSLFVSPHNDDETLFGAFTIMREQCDVLIVYDSYIQVARGADWCNAARRKDETINAMIALGRGASVLKFEKVRDDVYCDASTMHGKLIERFLEYQHLYLPKYAPDGHEQHNLVSLAGMRAAEQLSIPVTLYGTYTTKGKMKLRDEVVPTAGMVYRKLRALACYESQIRLDNCREHFMRDLCEYTEPMGVS